MTHRRTASRRRSPGLVVLVACLALLVACGGDDDATSTTAPTGSGPTTGVPPSAGTPSTSAAPSDVDPDGVVTMGADLSQPPHFDPATSQAAGLDLPRQALVYDLLLRPQLDGSYEPGLATEATIVDPQTIDVALREGVTFSDGTAFDAAAVRFSILRNRDVKGPQFFPELQQVADVEVVGAHAARIHLATPIAGAFFSSLGSLDTIVVSPTAAQDPSHDLDAQPVGAGPFLLERAEVGKAITFTRNPDFWGADQLRLAGVEITHVSAGASMVNALGTGAVDVASVDLSQVDAVTQVGAEVQLTSGTTSLVYGVVCKSTAPFDDVRVRQALNYAIDRDALNTALAAGKGSPAWALVPKGDPLYPAALEGHYAFDPTKARTLLAEAGVHDGFAFEIILSQSPLIQRATEIIQQQWAAIGVDVSIRQSATFFQDVYLDRKAPMTLNPSIQPGLRGFAQWSGAGVGNFCQYQDPALDRLVAELRTLAPDDPAAVDLWAQAQEIVVDQALSVFGLYLPSVLAYDGDAIGGVQLVQYPIAAAPSLDFTKAYVKA